MALLFAFGIFLKETYGWTWIVLFLTNSIKTIHQFQNWLIGSRIVPILVHKSIRVPLFSIKLKTRALSLGTTGLWMMSSLIWKARCIIAGMLSRGYKLITRKPGGFMQSWSLSHISFLMRLWCHYMDFQDYDVITGVSLPKSGNLKSFIKTLWCHNRGFPAKIREAAKSFIKR